MLALYCRFLGLLRTIFRSRRDSVCHSALFQISLDALSSIESLTKSNAPLTRWYFTPGQSCALPPRTITTECCCTLCPDHLKLAGYSIAAILKFASSPIHLFAWSLPHPQLYMVNVDIPSPGIYAVTIFPLLNRTLAIFLSPELGFLGFVVPTFKHTPFISGLFLRAGDRSFRGGFTPRPLRTTCISVHLCARDAGTAGFGSAIIVFRRGVEPIEGRIGREQVVKVLWRREGRTRRRRNWRGMARSLWWIYFATSKS
jgi:hypothetical protein